MGWHAIVYPARELEGAEVLHGVEDGRGGHEKLPVSKPASGRWEVCASSAGGSDDGRDVR